jgi:hypothetical protein
MPSQRRTLQYGQTSSITQCVSLENPEFDPPGVELIPLWTDSLLRLLHALLHTWKVIQYPFCQDHFISPLPRVCTLDERTGKDSNRFRKIQLQ